MGASHEVWADVVARDVVSRRRRTIPHDRSGRRKRDRGPLEGGYCRVNIAIHHPEEFPVSRWCGLRARGTESRRLRT